MCAWVRLAPLAPGVGSFFADVKDEIYDETIAFRVSETDLKTAKGPSGALIELGGEGWGQLLLWVIAVGLFAYGVFCVAEAKYRKAADLGSRRAHPARLRRFGVPLVPSGFAARRAAAVTAQDTQSEPYERSNQRSHEDEQP
jgi:Domain of Unknown Function (DUF1206)